MVWTIFEIDGKSRLNYKTNLEETIEAEMAAMSEHIKELEGKSLTVVRAFWLIVDELLHPEVEERSGPL